jgi:hypothetical protein
MAFLEYIYGGVLPSYNTISSSSTSSLSIEDISSLQSLAVHFDLPDLASHCEAIIEMQQG